MNLIFVFVFIFGLMIGSFINCFVWRLHQKEGLMDRSYCPKCRHQIAWYDNIPILSYLVLGGKCRKCKKKISIQYPIIEFLVACLFLSSFYFLYKEFNIGVYSYYNLSFDSLFLLKLLRDWVIIFVMVVIFIYDLRWFLIPDRVMLPSFVIIFVINLYLGEIWWKLLVLALIGAGFFLIQFIVSKGKWIGGGDVRLGFFIGLALARLEYLILAIMFAYYIGSIVGITLILIKKKEWTSQMPLGVFLSTATIITIFWGDRIIAWYISFL